MTSDGRRGVKRKGRANERSIERRKGTRLLFRASFKASCILVHGHRHRLRCRETTRCSPVVGKRSRHVHNDQGSERYTSSPTLPLCARARVCECSVSAVYGDRRRHLPSSLALLLRPASLRYERRDFLPDEDTISDSRPGFPSRPDLGLMYKNKLVRRATHATALVYVRGGVTMNSNVCRRLAEDIHRFSFASTRLRIPPYLARSKNGRAILYIRMIKIYT